MTSYQNAILLSVLAHPDDETFGMGGTLAYYALNGAHVHLICATRGEVGEVPPEMMSGFATIAELRESELRCAAKALGIEDVIFLDYRDSGMPGSPDNAHPNALAAQQIDLVAAKIVSHIRQIKPQVVLTFDPIGGYKHPDHIAIHQATVLAFKLAGDPNYQDPEKLPAYQPARLFYHTISRGFIKMAIWMLRLTGKDPSKWGKNGDIDMVSIAKESYPVHARVNYSTVTEIRSKASACHASQGGSASTGFVQSIMEKIFRSSDTFMQAYPEQAPAYPINDLFSGIDLVK